MKPTFFQRLKNLLNIGQQPPIENPLKSVLERETIKLSNRELKDGLEKANAGKSDSRKRRESETGFGFGEEDENVGVSSEKLNSPKRRESETNFGFGDLDTETQTETETEMNQTENLLEQEQEEEWDLLFYKRPLTIGSDGKISDVDKSWASQNGLDIDTIKGSYVTTRNANGKFNLLNNTALQATGMKGAEVYFSKRNAERIGPYSTAARLVDPAEAPSVQKAAEPELNPSQHQKDDLLQRLSDVLETRKSKAIITPTAAPKPPIPAKPSTSPGTQMVSLLKKKGIQISEADKKNLMTLSDAILTSEVQKIENNSSDHIFGFKGKDNDQLYYVPPVKQLNTSEMEGAEVYLSQPNASTAARVVEPAVESSPPAIADPKILPIKSSFSTESPNEEIRNFNRENLTHTFPEHVASKAPNVTDTGKNPMNVLLSGNTVLLTMLERAKQKEPEGPEGESWDDKEDKPDTDMSGSRATPVDLGNVHTK